jgi:seryl-tRNA synthetase
MLDIKFIRENTDIVKKAAKDKLMNVDIDRILELDTLIRSNTTEIDTLRGERNNLSKQILALKGAEKDEAVEKVRSIKERLAVLESGIDPLKEEFNRLMLTVPSIPRPEVPIGRDENDNVEIRRWGEIPKFDFEPKDHVELAETLDLIDTA